jgi:hypothetical protein
MIAGALLALTVAAQPGVPELPPRTDPEVAWLTWGNDWFGVPGARTDDHRTNEFAAGLRRGLWVVALDDSMLTLFDGESDRQRRHGHRLDEATLTLGRELAGDLTVGLGVRYRGDLGGEGVQDWWHRTLNDSTVAASYDAGGTALLGYGLWRHAFHPEPFFAPELLASAVASTAGEVSGDGAARLVWWTVSDVTIWAGLRYRVRAGDFDGAALEATAAYERGLCYEFGFSLGRALAFESTYSLRDRAAVGAFTYTTALP